MLQLADDDEGRDFRHHGDVACNEDDRAVFAHRPRKCHGKAGEQRGRDGGQDDLGEGLKTRGAQAGGSLFELFFSVFQHRLHRAHHKRQADKDQRNHDTRRLERQLNAHGLQDLADPSIARQQRGQRDAGHCGGQRKRQVHQRIHNLFARKLVAHQHPRNQQAKHQVDQRREERRTKSQLVRRHHAWRADSRPELVPGEREGLEDQCRQGDQHDDAQIKQRVAQRQAKAGQHPLGRTPTSLRRSQQR